MLVGEAGSRKSTCIKQSTFFLRKAGYNAIAADKTSKEKFLLDLEEGIGKSKQEGDRFDVTKGVKNPTMRELFGAEHSTEPAECLIAADEFNNFMGHSNVEFIDLLTNLWDYEGVYENRIKNGRSVRILDPTISIMGGNTSVGISMAFPKEVIGQGLFARVILVYSESSGKRIAFPKLPDPSHVSTLLQQLIRIKALVKGEMFVEPAAHEALKEIYEGWKDLEDVRLKSYSNRRFTHLLKLCIICAAACEETSITSTTVEYANSILHYTEHFMPKALGEFGKARNSDVVAKIISILEAAEKPLDVTKDIWPLVRRDLEAPKQLSEILQNLAAAGKIQTIGKIGILLRKEPPTFKFPWCKVTLLLEYLENQARDGLPY